MNKFDTLYKELMESMVAGGGGSVFGSPVDAPAIGSGGGAVGVNNDKIYGFKNGAIKPFAFGKIQSRNIKSNNKTRKKKKGN